MKSDQTNEGSQLIQLKTRSRTKAPSTLTLKVQTWVKQSHGLFDYQSPTQKIERQQFSIKQSSRIARNLVTRKTVVHDLKENEKQLSDRIQIFELTYSPQHKNYILKNSLPTSLQPILNINGAQNQREIERSRLFTSLFNQGPTHELKIGDFVKLGRVQLLILQVNNTKKLQAIDYQQVYGTKQFIFHLKQQLLGCCKICLSEQATEQDPLLNPCLCKGSCGVIHLECLRSWINNKVRIENLGKVITYNFGKFSCQICMAPFPSIIRLQNGNQSQLLKFERPPGPYILMQQCYQSQTKSARILHFIMPVENQRVRIGRAHNSQLMITDISVSRTHSSIMFTKNKFLLRDQGSKFGTLVELKEQKVIKQSMRLQYNGCSISIILPEKNQKKERNSNSVKKSRSINK